MRKLIVALVLLVAVMFVIGRMAELQAILETLKRGDFRFLAMAAVVQLIWLINIAASYRAIYRVMGIEEDLGPLLMMVTAANFVNIVAPSGGIGGVTIVLSEAKRRGYSPARATVASVMFLLYEHAGLLIVLALGLMVLFQRNNLNPSEVIASILLLGLALILAFLLVLGMRSADELRRALVWGVQTINRLLRPVLKRNYLSVDRAVRFSEDAAEGLQEIRQQPDQLALPLALSLSSKALLISVLFLVFLSFKTPFSPGTLIAGYSISQLFTIISPTPAGVGIVEGALTLTLSSLSIPLGAAAVIALSYRGIVFWLPFAIGLITFRILSHKEASMPKTPEEAF